jgi:hypothetical protein
MHSKCSRTCDTLGIAQMQALARLGSCNQNLYVVTQDDPLNLRSEPGIQPGTVLMSLPRAYEVTWEMCDQSNQTRFMGQLWYRVSALGWIVDGFLVPLADGRYRVNGPNGDPVNIRAAPSILGLDIGTLPTGFIVQGTNEPLQEGSLFTWRQVRVTGWVFAGYLAERKYVEELNN